VASKKTLNIVVPVYNESETIIKTLDEVRENAMPPCKIWIVYDFDEDTTIPVVKQAEGDYPYPVNLIKNEFGRGALQAIKTGLKRSTDGSALVIMADLSDDLCIVERMREMIERDGFDVVCGSRYMKGGRQIGGPLIKRTMSRVAGISLHLLTGIPTHDVSNSFKMYGERVLSTIEIESNGGFELGMELTVKAFIRGYKVGEIPSTWWDRTAGQSRFRLISWLPNYLHWYFYAIKGRLKGLPPKQNKKSASTHSEGVAS